MASGADPVIDYSIMTEGGGVIGTDPDPNVSTGIGTWEKIGPNRFGVTFVHFLNDQGAPGHIEGPCRDCLRFQNGYIQRPVSDRRGNWWDCCSVRLRHCSGQAC
jgi:hypothetical protein